MIIQENGEGIKLNVLHQLLVYANGVNLLSKTMNTLKKNTEGSPVADKYVCLGRKSEKNICSYRTNNKKKKG
jgi:hypothetical protein